MLRRIRRHITSTLIGYPALSGRRGRSISTATFDTQLIGGRRRKDGVVISLLAVAVLVVLALPSAYGDQADSHTYRAASGYLDAGQDHSCALLDNGQVRCWGNGTYGRLGYGNMATIGDNEAPGSAGPVNLGAGRSARAISAGHSHTCALLDNGRVRCWGFGGAGQLGYGNQNDIGDDEAPGSVGAVNLGAGRTARAISAGNVHSCALLDNGAVRCWGDGGYGRLGYGNTKSIGDNEAPGSVGPVNLGAGRTARAISAGEGHTCALLDNGRVRCWGAGGAGELGYGNTSWIGDNEAPGSVGPVNLGAGRSARAISAGTNHTCALLDNGAVRCWGFGAEGRLGYGNTDNIGDNEAPGSVGTVNLGAERTARAISAGGAHTCALLDDGQVRCWGYGDFGQLGYGSTNDIGDDETPGSAGPVDLGAGRSARAISTGAFHTCALLDKGRVRCWGEGDYGALGYGNQNDIGDNEAPGSVGPVSLGRLVATRAPSALSLNAKPKRDRSAPYRFRAAGALKGLFAADTATCAGKVKVIAKQGSRTVATKRTRLRVGRRSCAYATRIAVPSRDRTKLRARFGGNSNVAPAGSPVRRVRAG